MFSYFPFSFSFFSIYLYTYLSTYMHTTLPLLPHQSIHPSIHPTHPPPLLQVAYERTQPHGRILGIDIIPAQPPHGVSTIQGNFLSRRVQQSVKNFLLDPERGRPRRPLFSSSPDEEDVDDDVVAEEPSYIDLERHMNDHDNGAAGIQSTSPAPSSSSSSSSSPSLEQKQEQEQEQEQENDETKMVHVVLSDMCAPWDQTSGFWKRSLSDPYNRMMNTTGIKFSDHAGSMVCYFSFCFPFYFPSSHLPIFVFQSLAVCSQLDSTQIKSIAYAILTTIYVRACRISATRLCDLPSKR